MRELHCRHSGAAHIHTHTHTLCVSANHAGARNFWYVQPDCLNNRPVKQYIVRGLFATASQTTHNKSKLTKRCRRVLLRRLHVLFPINEAVTSSLHSNYSFFAEIIIFHWLIYYIYMQNICVVVRVKCEELQVGCHTYYYYFSGRVYRCNFNFNFRQCNMILWS